MNNSIVQHEYEGFPIRQQEDGYVNLTDMVKVGNKQLGDWKRLGKYRAYLLEVSSKTGIAIDKLVYVGGPAFGKSTMGHPLMALHLAHWLSPAFHLWFNQHILSSKERKETKVKRLPSEYAAHLASLGTILDDDVELAIHMFMSFAKQLNE